MAKYKNNIAGNKKVEFIHVSLDSNKQKAQTWAAKERFPWLHVLPEKVNSSGLKKFHTSGSVPFYCLIDGDGEVLAKGSKASFAKAKELAK